MKFDMDESLFIKELIEDSIIKCYQVNGKCKGAKNKNGIRAAVYNFAEKYHAHYSPDRSKSVWYDDESPDLYISIFFENKHDAQDFRYFLGRWHLNNPVIITSSDVIVEEIIKERIIEKDELSPILFMHYIPGDSESLIQSLDEYSCCHSSLESLGTAISLDTPLAKFQSIEDLSSFGRILKPYCCHIKPKAKFKDLKDNESNQLAASWTPFHQCFDGLNTIDSVTGEQNIPLIALNPVMTDTFREEMIGEPPEKRQRVELDVEYRNEEVAEKVKLKDGSTKISDTKWRTFVHVKDAKTFCESLKWKYEFAHKKWEEADHFDQMALYRS